MENRGKMNIRARFQVERSEQKRERNERKDEAREEMDRWSESWKTAGK